MDLQQLVRKAIPRPVLEQFVPPETFAAWDAEERQAALETRVDQARGHEAAVASLTAELRQANEDVDRLAAEEHKKQAALIAAQQRTGVALKRKQAITYALTSSRRRFEASMRDSAPMNLLREFATRVDRLIAKAIPVTNQYDLSHRITGIRQTVFLRGDPTARRHALYELRRNILQAWPLEALSDAELEAKFAAAVEALPAITPPPSLEEYKRQRDAA